MRKITQLCTLCVCFITALSDAALIKIGDTETFELDANRNLQGLDNGAYPMLISLTAGEYELEFLNTNPNRTAWAAGPGWPYWVGGMRIYGENELIFNGVDYYGTGGNQQSAYANAEANNTLIHTFSVSKDNRKSLYHGL